MSIVIVGAGEMGYQLARRLSYERHDVILIDRHSERVNYVSENLDVQALLGRGSDPSAFLRAGIQRASMLVAVTDSDEVNLVACFVAGHFNKYMKKVARLREEDFHDYPEILDEKHLGIDLVISPENEAVRKIMQVLQVPSATDVMEFAEGRIKLFGIRITHDSPLLGRSLMTLRDEYPDERFLIPAIFRESDVIIPRGHDYLKAHDTVYIMAAADAVPSVLKMAGARIEAPKRVMILGETSVALKMAQRLEKQNFSQVSLVGADPARCEEMASVLDNTMVLKTSSVDEEFLRSEGISDTDVFLAMTSVDEDNALKALLARRMGARRVAAVTNRVEYHRLLSAVGLDIVVNPRLAGASRILQYIRKGRVMSVFMLPGEGVEAIEFEAVETSQLVGRALRKIKFPRGAILGALQRGMEFVIPDGDTVVMPGDRIVFFARKDAIPKVEKLVSVGLDYF